MAMAETASSSTWDVRTLAGANPKLGIKGERETERGGVRAKRGGRRLVGVKERERASKCGALGLRNERAGPFFIFIFFSNLKKKNFKKIGLGLGR